MVVGEEKREAHSEGDAGLRRWQQREPQKRSLRNGIRTAVVILLLLLIGGGVSSHGVCEIVNR